MKPRLRESANLILSYNKNAGKSSSGLSLIAALILAALSSGPRAQAQAPIAPATDGTGTQVQQNGNQFDITGGSPGGANGANLFHSFEQFGLDANQIANFLATPELRNILGRVVGGDPSIINGLIQVTGGNPNLFLMNPAGMVFGADARLNVPASFFATTANGIGFGENQWFGAIGSNDYAALVGEPRAFSFSGINGALANFGDLSVNPGEALGLSGSSVLNAGTLTAPGGEITITAVPGTNTVLLGQAGHLLSLQIDSSGLANLQQPTNLPSLLGGSASTHASEVKVNADGTVTLAGSSLNNVPSSAGTAIVSGNLDVSADASNGASTAGKVGIFGRQLGIATDIDASGTGGGGSVFIGGDVRGGGSLPTAIYTFVGNESNINADALTNGDGGSVVIWADKNTFFNGTISARGGSNGGDGGFVETSGKINLGVGSEAAVDASAANGQPGEWLLDPTDITISNGTDDLMSLGGLFANFFNPLLLVANITPATIEASLNAGTSVTIMTAGGSLGVNGDITAIDPIEKTAGGDATLTLTATRNLNINSGADITSSSNKLNVVLSATGAINITDATIDTKGGNFTATGTGSAASTPGININTNASINAGDGNISLTGTGGSGGTNNDGVEISSGSSLSVTGIGNIAINGVAGSGTDNNDGVEIDSASVLAGSGSIDIAGNTTGTGGGTGEQNQGIMVDNARIESTGDGNITLKGQGSAGTHANYGIGVFNDSLVTSSGGDITLSGTGGDASESQNVGVYLFGNTTLQTGAGAISIAGDGGSGSGGNAGIILQRVVSVSSGGGEIAITGTGGTGNGTNNEGIWFSDSTIESTGGGNITLTGKGGVGTLNNFGILATGNISTAASGNITLKGTGGGGGGNGSSGNNMGVFLISTTTLRMITTDAGTISIEGVGDSGTDSNFGVGINSYSVRSESGSISITGTGEGTGSNNQGIWLERNNTLSIGNIIEGGDITLTGTGAAGLAGIDIEDTSINSSATGTGKVTLSADEIDIRGTSQVQGSGSLQLQPLTPNADVTIGSSGDTGAVILDITDGDLSAIVDGFASVTIGRSDSSGRILVNSTGVSFSDPTTIQSPSGWIAVDGTITGIGDASVTLTGNTTLNANIATANQNIELNGTATLGSNAILNTGAGSGNININSTVDGTQSLTLEAGTGNINFSGVAGNSQPLGNITANSSGATEFNTINAASLTTNAGGTNELNGDIATSGAVNFNDPTTLGADLSINAGGDITFSNILDGTQDLTLNAGANNITFSDAIGNSQALGSLTANSSGTTQFNSTVNAANLTTDLGGNTELNGNVTTETGTQSYNDIVTVNGDISLTAQELDFTNTVSGTGNLLLQPFNSNQAMAIGGTGAISAWDLNASEINLINGFATLTVGRTDSSGTTTISGGTFSSPTTIKSPSGTIALNGSTAGTGNASITLEAPDIDLNGSIATDNQNISLTGTDPVTITLTGDTSLSTGSGLGDITFAGTVDGNHNLSLSAGSGLTNFQEAVGGTDRLGSLTISSGSAVNSNGGIRTNNSDLSFTMPVNLTGDSTFDAGSATANFGNNLNAGSHDLTVTAAEIDFGGPVSGTGIIELRPADASANIQLGGTDAGTTALELSSAELGQLQDGFSRLIIGRTDGNGAITVDSSGVTFSDPTTLRSPEDGGLDNNLIVNGTINLTDNSSLTLEIFNRVKLNADIISTGGNIDFGDSGVSLGSNAQINTGTGGGNITIGGRIDGTSTTLSANGQELTLNAGTGQVDLGGDIGQTDPLLGLSVTGSAASLPNKITTDNGNITVNADASLNGDSTFSAGTGTIEFGSDLSAGANDLTLNADEINFNGGSSSATGSGDLTLQPTTPSLDINIANASDTAGLDLNSGDVDALQNGFAEITIGRADGNGAITMETVEFSDPVRLRSPVDGGTLSVNGAVTLLDDAILIREIAGLVTIDNDITQASGDIIFEEDILLGADVSFTTGGGNIIFEGLLDGNQELTLSASGFIDFQKAVGLFEPLGGLSMSAAEVRVAGGIATNDSNLTFNMPVNLQGDSTLNAGTGILEFNNALNAGSHKLGLVADEINLNDAVSGTGALEIQPKTAAADIVIAGTDNNTSALDITNTELSQIQEGFSSITIGQSDGTGTVSVNTLSVSDPVAIRSGLGVVNIDGAITGTDNASISIEGGTTNLGANISTDGENITIGKQANLATDISLDTGGGSGDITFTGTVDGAQVLSLNAGSGEIRFEGVAGGSNRLGSLSLQGSQTYIKGGIFVDNSDLTFNMPTTLTEDSEINAGTATLTFNGDVDALAFDLTLSADEIDLSAALSGTGNLLLQPATDSLDVAVASTTLSDLALDLSAAEIGQISDQFESLTIGSATGSGNITVESVTLGSPTTMRAPSGELLVLGDITSNAELTLAAPNLTLNANIDSNGSTTLEGNASLGADVEINSNNNDIAINGTIDGNRSLTLKAGSSQVQLGGAVGSTNPLAGLNVTAATTNISAAVTTNNTDINFSGSVTVSGSGGSFNAGTGNLSFGSSLAALNQQDLILTANEIDFNGSVSSSGFLVLQPASPERDIAIGGTAESSDIFDLTASEVANLQDGFRSITIGRPDGSGSVAIDSITLSDPTTVQVPIVPGSIAVNGDTSLTDNGSLTLIAPDLNLNANIQSQGGNVTLDGNVELGTDASIETNNGAITITGTTDGDRSLTLDAGTNLIRLEQAVGSTTPLAGLQAIASETTLLGAVATNGDISFSGDVTAIGLANSFNAGTGTLSFGSALAAQSQQDLTLTADEINLGGTVSSLGNLLLQPATPGLDIAIGSNAESSGLDLTADEIDNLQDGFRSVTIGRADGSGAVSIESVNLSDPTTVRVPLEPGSIDVNGDIALTDNGGLTLIAPETTLAADITSSGGEIAINSPTVSLDSDVTIGTGSGDLNIQGTVDGFHQFTLDAGSGKASFGGNLGDNAPLAGLSVTAGTADLQANITTDNGEVNIQAPITLQSDVFVTTGPGTQNAYGDVTATSTIDGPFRLIINAGNVEVGGDIGGNEPVESVDIDAQGNVNLGNTTSSGGDASIVAAGDINTGDISTVPTAPENPGGDIDLTSTDGGISTGNLDSSASGPGGDITLSAAGDVTAANITSTSNTASAGDIAITSTGGSISTQNITAENLGEVAGSAGKPNQRGGNITLEAARSITTGNISSRSVAGQAGDISLDAVEDISVGDVNSWGLTQAGDIDIVSQEGSVSTGNIIAFSSNVAGNIALQAAGNISTGFINASSVNSPGTINITSTNGGIINTGPISNSAFRTGEVGEVNQVIEDEELIETVEEQIPIEEAIPVEEEIPFEEEIPVEEEIPSETTIQEDSGGPPPILPPGEASPQEPGGQGAGGTVEEEPSSTASASSSTVEEVEAEAEPEPIAIAAESESFAPAGVEAEEAPEEVAPVAAAQPFVAPEANISVEAQLEPEALEEAAVEEAIEPIAETQPELAPIIEAPPALASAESNSANNASPVATDSSANTSARAQETETNLAATQQQILSGSLEAARQTTAGNSVREIGTALDRQQILNVLSINAANTLAAGNVTDAIPQIEEAHASEYAEYFGDESLEDAPVTAQGIRDTLSQIVRETGTKPAIVYALVLPDQLEVVLVAPDGRPIRKVVPEAPKQLLIKTARELSGQLTNPRQRNSTRYLQNAQLLYKWLIAPIEQELQDNDIDTLLFSMDSGLRSLPIAALHDGQQFLVEKYSLGLIPSISLTNTRYRSLENTQVLAMGASEFPDAPPLPAVPIELETITEQLWQGEAFLNQEFTRENLLSQREDYSYEILHLATHGEFQAGAPKYSYIHFGDRKLGLDELRDLRLKRPQVELLVLSACRTAVGDESAELGFAGLAVQAGVKSALASLWYVSDKGTLVLMSEFYRQLGQVPIKAEALRLAQLAMIRGKVKIENGRIVSANRGKDIELPEELAGASSQDFSHPYYWSAFTMIGSPW